MVFSSKSVQQSPSYCTDHFAHCKNFSTQYLHLEQMVGQGSDKTTRISGTNEQVCTRKRRSHMVLKEVAILSDHRGPLNSQPVAY